MYIKSDVTKFNYTVPYSRMQAVPAPFSADFGIINSGDASFEQKTYSKADIRIKQLKEEFQLAKDEQGILGGAWNGIKNLFKTEYSSDNIESAINKLNPDSTDEEFKKVEKMIAEYRNKQDLAVDTMASTGTAILVAAAGAKVGSLIGAAAGSIIPGAGTAVGGAAGAVLGVIGGIIVGAVSNICLNQLENMTDNVDNNAWHNDRKIGEQASSGAVMGAIMMLTAGLNKYFSSSLKSYFGLTKQGVILAENGTANVAKTAGYTALAEGIGGAASTIAISDGKYLVDCAIDDEKEFSAENLAQTTLISGISGGLINAGFGAVQGYSNATTYNNQLLNQTAIAKSSNTKTEKTKKFVKKNLSAIVKKNMKSGLKSDLNSVIKKNNITLIGNAGKAAKSTQYAMRSKPGVILSPDTKK